MVEHPIHAAGRGGMGEDEARAYEQAVFRMAGEAVKGAAWGLIGVALSVRLEGARPETRVVIRYRSHKGGAYEADWFIWDEEHWASNGGWESPSGQGGLIASNWLDGSIRADNDPYGPPEWWHGRKVAEH
jgi:hypothetical protein